MSVKFNIKSEFPTLLRMKGDLSKFSIYLEGIELSPNFERLSSNIESGELEWNYALIGKEGGLNQYVIRASGEITIEDISSKDESILKSFSDKVGRMILEIKKNGESKPIKFELQSSGKLDIKNIQFY